MGKINKLEHQLFENLKKMNKSLARQNKKIQIIQIQNEKADITTDSTKISKYCTQLCPNRI